MKPKVQPIPSHPQLAGLKAALDIVETRKKQLDLRLSQSVEANELGRIAAMFAYEITILEKVGKPLKTTRHAKT